MLFVGWLIIRSKGRDYGRDWCDKTQIKPFIWRAGRKPHQCYATIQGKLPVLGTSAELKEGFQPIRHTCISPFRWTAELAANERRKAS